MARKSRKNLPESEPIYSTTYKAAGYIRLSVVKEGRPSDSIENQKKIIESFEGSMNDIILQKFCVDENVSGTTFERKAFQEMLDDIAKGEINCVIVKDLSRFARDAIETGFYTEQYFPSRRVRFVSINDCVIIGLS